jgi:hypothetical protein
MYQKIIEIKHIREALKHIHFDTWVVLDLDNTVMTPQIAFGGDAWFEELFTHARQKNIEPSTAHSALMSLYNTAQHFVRTSAVEPNMVSLIKALQDMGIPIIGLTARGYEIRQQTLRQLNDIGVDFSRNSIVPNQRSFSKGGVIFCEGGDKGEHLSLFLSQSGQTPRHVVMLDDKNKHLERVLFALKQLGVNFTGFRYGHLDEEVKQFSMEAANIQLAHLWSWLSDRVQEDVKKLKLLSDEWIGTLNPMPYSEHFFHPDTPLTQIPVKTVQEQEFKTLKRTKSTSSFFYEENQRTKYRKLIEDEVDELSDERQFINQL